MINKVVLVGNVGSISESRTLPNGGRVANFSLATSESWKDKDGTRREKTEWHRIVVFNNNLVQVVEKYVKKGTMLYIEGSLRTSKYTDKSGVEKYTTEVVIQGYSDNIKILNSRSGSDGSPAIEGGGSDNSFEDNKLSASNKIDSAPDADIDDDIPF